jgi:uncharacterized membrane protein
MLLLALVGLGIAFVRLTGRVAALEREVEGLQWGSAPRPAADAPPKPATVIRSQPAPAAGSGVPDAVETAPPPREWIGDGAPEQPPAAAEATAPAPRGESVGGFFERWVGGRLMIWVGGIALAVSGVLLVRYSIQIGLITPGVQMAIAALFGLILIGLGEAARSRPAWSVDARVAQALVGAGILVLYATAYGSLVVHHLIGGGTAFALMIAVTAAALVLALRHGSPAAVMGLIGGFATPLLVGERSQSAIPLLAYLSLLDVALFALAGRRGWTWLAAGAALISFGWGAAILFWPPQDALSAGAFILAVGAGASLLRAGRGWQLDFLRPAAIALVELAFLVAREDVGLPAWGLFGALSAACFFLERRKPEFRPLPLIALLLALLLLALKSGSQAAFLPAVAAAVTLLFAAGSVPALLRRQAPRLAAATFCLAFLAPGSILHVQRPALLDRPAWGLLFLLLAAGPAWLAWRRRGDASEDGRHGPLAMAAGTAAVLAAIGARDLVPPDLLGAAWLAVTLALALAARRLGDRAVAILALDGAAVSALVAAAAVPALWETLLGSVAGDPALAPNLPGIGLALEAMLLPAALLAVLWRLLPEPLPRARVLALALAGLFGVAAAYIVFKHGFGLSSREDFVARGLAERTILNQALFLAGWLVCRGRIPVPGLGRDGRWRAGMILTALAAARLVWFDMLLHNPAATAQNVGALPVLNLIAPAYLMSTLWLYSARRGAGHELRSGVWLVLSLASLVLGVMLMVRQGFQGPLLDRPGITSTESYGYSLAGLLLSIALLLGGIRGRDKAIRVAGLGLLTATTVKVFWIDAGALEGVLRILSFLVLGLALIGIGKLYTKVLDAEAAAG